MVFDPYSTLLSVDAEIGTNNVFYPGVVINGHCRIGNANTFHVATHLLAENGAHIIIGNGATFGPGGVHITVTGANVDAESATGFDCATAPSHRRKRARHRQPGPRPHLRPAASTSRPAATTPNPTRISAAPSSKASVEPKASG